MSDSAPSVPKAASEPPSKEALIADWYAQTSPRTDDERRTPASPVSGRNLTPEEQAAYTEFRKRHATKLSGPVSGETVAELEKALGAFQNAVRNRVIAVHAPEHPSAPFGDENDVVAAHAALVALYERQREQATYWEGCARTNFADYQTANDLVERLKADSLTADEARVLHQLRDDALWLVEKATVDSAFSKLRRLSQSSEDSEKMNDSSALQLTPDEASKAWNAVTHYAPATNFETRQHYYSLIEKLDKGRRASGGRKGLTICAACEDGAHELCGLQSWCKCTCRPQSSESPK